MTPNTDKSIALKKINQLIAENNLDKKEILNLFENKSLNQSSTQESKNKISTVILYLGGLILFMGIVFFVQMNWGIFNLVGRIGMTLGLAISCYFAALILEKENKLEQLSNILHLISIALIPTGLFVTAFEFNFLEPYGVISTTIIFGILTLHYIFANIYKPKLIFQFLVIGYLNYFILCLFALINQYTPTNFEYLNVAEYLTITLGISNLLVGFYYAQLQKIPFTRFFYLVGSTLVLTGFFDLMMNSYLNSIFNIGFEVIYLLLLVAFLYLSLITKRKIILFPTILFFIGYLIQITEKYFANTFGWPISLIFIGIILIGSTLLYLQIKKEVIGD